MSQDQAGHHAVRYRIARRIKRGGTAEVLEASVEGERGFARKVAIKRLLPGPDADPSLHAALIDEGRILSRLHHANIVSVFDFGFIDGQPFLVMEWVDGDDVSSLIERARELGQSIPIEVALHVATEVAHALSHAHRARDAAGQPLSIVHRDVSPENILLSVEGDVKLTDFGIAWARKRLEATGIGVAKGKLAYMAPEQLRGDPVDPRTDLFALGCTLHVMLTGRAPFSGDPALGASIDADLPNEIAALITRATRPSPKERYGSADEMASALGELLARRLTRDARSMVRSWIAPLVRDDDPTPEAKSPRRGDLVDLELVLDPSSSDGVPHYAAPVPPRLSAGPPKPPARDGMIGATIGAHRIEELIGVGGSARVYRAVHLELGRQQAIKLLAEPLARDLQSVSRLRHEALALGRISHPNVVGVFDFAQTAAGQHYLVLELVPGPTLAQVLRTEGKLSLLRATRIAQQIVRGLIEAHRHNLLHRDLKPGNIKLTREGDREAVKILDFGLVRDLDPDNPLTRLTAAGTSVGTPRYMAPEIVEGLEASRASDLYALGVILYEMVSGKPPFTGPLPDLLIHLQRPAPRLELLDGIGPLVEKLLDRAPKRRPAAEVVLEALDAIEETLSARTQATEIQARKDDLTWVPTTRVLDPTPLLPPRVAAWTIPVIWIFAAVVLAALAIATILLTDRGRGRQELPTFEAPVVVPSPAFNVPAPVQPPTTPPTTPAITPPTTPPTTPPAEKAPVKSRPPPGSRAPASPAAATELKPAQLRAAFDQQLRTRGLTTADLQGREPWAGEVQDLDSAEATHDPAAIRAALEKLSRDAISFPVDAPALKRKLARINALLEHGRKAPEADRIPFEKRYLDLRGAYDPDLDDRAAARLMREAGALEIELKALLR